MSGTAQFDGTQEEWDALVKKERADQLEKDRLFFERLLVEERELGEKLIALSNAFTRSDFKEKVGDFQYSLLILQQSAMITYRHALILRIDDLRSKMG